MNPKYLDSWLKRMGGSWPADPVRVMGVVERGIVIPPEVEAVTPAGGAGIGVDPF